jgi:hypothetical protein
LAEWLKALWWLETLRRRDVLATGWLERLLLVVGHAEVPPWNGAPTGARVVMPTHAPTTGPLLVLSFELQLPLQSVKISS